MAVSANVLVLVLDAEVACMISRWSRTIQYSR